MDTHAASNRRQTRQDSATRPGLRSGKNVPAREKKKEDLDPEHQRALKRLDQMTEWKETLAKENAVLRKENKGLKGDLKEARGEVERLAARYEDAWREKALLKERISGPALLPLEVLLNIAGFVAGDNNYGTLLNFAVASKLVKEEITSILYETVLLTQVLPFDMSNIGPLPDEHKYTRFVYASQNSSASSVQKLYPNLRAVLSFGNHHVDSTNGPNADREVYTFCRASLTVFRPVRTDALASLLKYPVKWGERPYPTITHPITGIDQVDIDGDGALVGGVPRESGYLFRNLTAECEVRARCLTRLDGFRETVAQLVHLIPIIPKDYEPTSNRSHYPTIRIRKAGEDEVDAWLENVATFHLREPRLRVNISVMAAATRDHLQRRSLTAASAYESAWERIKHSIKALGPGRELDRNGHVFFDIDYFESDGDEPYGYLIKTGQLEFDAGTGGFVSKVVEIDTDRNVETVVWSQNHVVDSGSA